LVEGLLRLHTLELDIFLPLAVSFFTFQQGMRSQPFSKRVAGNCDEMQGIGVGQGRGADIVDVYIRHQ
jgi:hypothetical protein